jgi:hypothetical protein
LLLPFDQFAVAALIVVVVVGVMRWFYGAWPWEASKTWYRTRQTVAYVEALRREKKRDSALPAPGPLGDSVDTSSDSFDRDKIAYDNSAAEMTPPPGAAVAEELAASLPKSTEKQPIVRIAMDVERA